MRFTENYWLVASALVLVAGGIMLGARGAEAQTKSVQVVNTPSAPAIASLIDEPGRIPYFSTQSTSSASGFRVTFTFPPVPAGHRLVVTHIAGFYETTLGTATTDLRLFSITPPAAGSLVTAFITPNANQVNEFDMPVQAYFDAGQKPQTVAEIETTPLYSGLRNPTCLGT